jgi:hypothetical protein
MTTTPETDCSLCIDCMVPAGIHPVFGAVYRACPACCTGCGACGASAVYPAESYVFEQIVTALDAVGFDTNLCHQCLGVIGVHPRIWGVAG